MMNKGITALAVAAALVFALPVHAGGISNDLLLSSAWCTFAYNKTTGYSNTTKVRFNKNGTYGTGGRAEGSTTASRGATPARAIPAVRANGRS